MNCAELKNDPDVVVLFAPKVWKSKDFTPFREGSKMGVNKGD